MKNKIILITILMSAASASLAKTQNLYCVIGSPEKLQMLNISVSETQASKGLGNITLSNLSKPSGWMTFEKAETTVTLQYTVDMSSKEKKTVGALVNMGKSGLILINPIFMMNNSIYTEIKANALGFSYPKGEKALCFEQNNTSLLPY